MSAPSISKVQASSINEKWLVFGLISLYLLIAFIWHFSTDAPWDDDCITRYYNVKEALKHPGNFISLWNRPLFVLIFFLPFQLGKSAILLMAFISAFNAYILYLVARKLSMPNAFLVIPLFLFQAFFFTISRSALAEPLAATLLTLGFLFYLNKRFLYFALVGSLLPLARLELSLFLVLWAYVLIINKQWKYIFLLFIPTIIWSIIGGIMEGNSFWLIQQTIGKADEVNRYGQTSFWHYFQRYIYFLNPIVFYFFIIGFFESFRKQKFKLLLTGQFLLGFAIYVVFSWKLSMGQAAGFLRHLATLSPLAALLSLSGFNFWINSFSIAKQKTLLSPTIRIAMYSLIMILVTYLFFSKELIYHHTLTDNDNYTNLYVIIILSITYAILIFRFNKSSLSKTANFSIGVLLIISVMSFTMYTEKPDIHNNPERRTMKIMAELISDNYSDNYDVYVNHIWFPWVNDLDRLSNKQHTLSIENISKSNDLSLFIWDNHYCKELGKEYESNFFQKNENFIEVFHLISSDLKFITSVYQKIEPKDHTKSLEIFNRLIAKNLKIESLYYNRASLLFNKMGEENASIKDFSKAIEINNNYIDALYSRGLAYYKIGQIDLAIDDFKKVIRNENKYFQAYLYYGDLLSIQGKFLEAIPNYTRVIELDSDNFGAYLNRAVAYFNINEFEKALVDYNTLIDLAPSRIDQLYHSKAVVLLKMERTSEACKLLYKAKSLGNPNSNLLIEYYCSDTTK